jgi:hypothetical protein
VTASRRDGGQGREAVSLFALQMSAFDPMRTLNLNICLLQDKA